LAFVPHRDGGVVRVCFDFDDHEGDGGNVHLADRVDRFLGASSIRFTSKSGKGLHCFYALAEPMAIEAFNEWSKSWGFNRRGDIECFPKTEKRSAVWLPNEPNERGGDRYLCGTIDSCIIRQLPKAPSKRLAKPTLDFLRGFVAPGYRNDALNSASYHCAKARIPESEARSLCLRAADLCGLLSAQHGRCLPALRNTNVWGATQATWNHRSSILFLQHIPIGSALRRELPSPLGSMRSTREFRATDHSGATA
jgi:hypothetical protein